MNMNSNLKTNAERAAHILKQFQPDIEKGGEGSRGGKVIGHTKSGKPVYENSIGNSHGFTQEDHKDAKNLHYELYDKHSSFNWSGDKNDPEFKKKYPHYDAEKAEKHKMSFAYHRDRSERPSPADKKSKK